MNDEHNTLLQVSNVTKTFVNGAHETEVLRGLDLKLEKGESLAIVGGSGAGKSTLLHIIGTLEKPSSGVVLYDGRDPGQWSDGELSKFRNQNLGFVFQFHYLLNEFTALENVAMPGRIAGLSKAESEEHASSLLMRMGMGHREGHFPNQLSGGEQQRVAIARALIMNPSIILADEPTGNLDKKNSAVIQDLFLNVVEDYGVGLITVTHDSKFAEAFSRSKTMKDGLWS
jgi:lipoprotein-releasing system ATP-binding protein